MPLKTVEQVREKETRLKQRLAEKGGSMEQADRRELGRKLRRTQRKRRRLAVAAEKAARAAGGDKGEDQKAE